MSTKLAAENDRHDDEIEEGAEVRESVVVRFAGDSGDGMQLTGTQFAKATALMGNDLTTFPDFPAEIRAPAGTTFGVSAYQINFGSYDIMTAGDAPDVLVAMNPAALKVNYKDVIEGGIIILDTGSFTDRNLDKAGFDVDPRTDGTLAAYQVVELDISAMTLEAVKEFGLSNKDALRSKNMWTLGLILWMFGRKRQPIIDWLKEKFAKKPDIADSNIAALNAGHAFGETAEMSGNISRVTVGKAEVEPGIYRTVTGGEAIALGLIVGAKLADLPLVFGSYPITPASTILHQLSRLREYGVTTFQAEDEIAAVCAAIGASYAGAIGVTSSSGPGIALKTEAIGLAIGVELPLVIINSQRGGPSTGLPTKTEQSDLFQAVYGRNADSPLAVIAASSSTNCFDAAIEAIKIATTYMTPVMLLTDGYLANAAEPWRIPDINEMETFPAQKEIDPEGFHPYRRDEKTLARDWALPGMPGLEHRVGGLEKSFETGNISYDPENHQKMTEIRREKVLGIAQSLPDQTVESGDETGQLAVVGWGSTFGPIERAVRLARSDGLDVAHIHIRHLWPLPENLGRLLGGFEQILVPEMNDGQLVKILRAEYLVPAEGLNKVSGQPFKVAEILDAIKSRVEASK